ncbi:hypothetical protein [Actinoplanes solisilvae]|uniref:hypothetical protein n=1 Tax=Actinoplanes solisilvae TaxID=2486853 RepID=UPI001F0C2432|nr:hypothetical protein [Actinoplanes solisilvae]
MPVGDGGPIVRLSPAERPDDFVRHTTEGAIIVQRAPRDLAATQFRFEARADGTEVLRSVDRPDRLLGAAMVLDATPLPLRREVGRTGLKLRSEAGYLRVSGSTISVGSSGTVFRLS